MAKILSVSALAKKRSINQMGSITQSKRPVACGSSTVGLTLWMPGTSGHYTIVADKLIGAPSRAHPSLVFSHSRYE